MAVHVVDQTTTKQRPQLEEMNQRSNGAVPKTIRLEGPMLNLIELYTMVENPRAAGHQTHSLLSGQILCDLSGYKSTGT